MNNVPETPAGYIVNGVVVDFRVTSAEWKDQRPEPLITNWDLFGTNIRLQSKSGSIDFPVARGMSYVTALYNDLTPQFFTQHAILQVSSDMFQSNDTYTGRKFKLSFNDNPTSTFIIYALGKEPLTLKKSGNNNLVAASKYNGPIQVTKLPSKESEIVLDFNRGTWATGGDIKFDLNRYIFNIKLYELSLHHIEIHIRSNGSKEEIIPKIC